MATVINNPSSRVVRSDQAAEGPGTGFVVGLILLILLAILFFVYGLPALRSSRSLAPSSGTSINGTVNVNPGGSSGGTSPQNSSGGSSGGTNGYR